jgi:hypothetical protein
MALSEVQHATTGSTGKTTSSTSSKWISLKIWIVYTIHVPLFHQLVHHHVPP